MNDSAKDKWWAMKDSTNDKKKWFLNRSPQVTMLTYIKGAFKRDLEGVEWMTEESRAAALLKLDNIFFECARRLHTHTHTNTHTQIYVYTELIRFRAAALLKLDNIFECARIICLKSSTKSSSRARALFDA
jgi:hypothetical protein